MSHCRFVKGTVITTFHIHPAAVGFFGPRCCNLDLNLVGKDSKCNCWWVHGCCSVWSSSPATPRTWQSFCLKKHQVYHFQMSIRLKRFSFSQTIIELAWYNFFGRFLKFLTFNCMYFISFSWLGKKKRHSCSAIVHPQSRSSKLRTTKWYKTLIK